MSRRQAPPYDLRKMPPWETMPEWETPPTMPPWEGDGGTAEAGDFSLRGPAAQTYAEEEEKRALLEELLAAQERGELPPELAQVPPRQPATELDGLLFEPGQEPRTLARTQQPSPIPDNPYEEEVAQRAPIQLDEQVIDVPSEVAPESGTTWAQEEMAAAEGQDQRNRFQSASERLSTPETGNGQRSNLYGNDDDQIFDPQKRIARATELYQQQGPEEPDASSRRWEDEFLRSRKYATDEDIQRSFMLQSVFGNKGDNFRMRDSMMQQRQQYDQGLSKAHERDLSESKQGGRGKRISLGLAQAIASTGRVSPEAAVQLRENDQTVKAYVSGMYAQGLTERKQDISIHQGREKELGRTARAEAGMESREGIADDRNATAVETQRMRDAARVAAAKARGQGGGGGLNPDAFAGHLDELINLGNIPLIKRYQAGDPEAAAALTPAQRAVLDREIAKFPSYTPQKQMEVMATGSKREGGGADQVATYLKKASEDPKYALKTQREITDTARALKHAAKAWEGMSYEGRKAFVQLSSLGDWSKIVKSKVFADNPGDANKAAAVFSVLNALVKHNAGSAVTESEWGRTATEIGLASSGWDPFNTTEAIEGYLNRARERVLHHREDYTRVMGGWK